MDVISRSSFFRLACLAGFAVFILFSSCSETQPCQEEFREWLSAVYHRETGLTADEMIICVWDRTPPEILKKAPEVDGLQVEAMIFTAASNNAAEQSEADTAIVHYVYCRYFKAPDEWFLHAASWGGGFWKQEPSEWGHLVQNCRDYVEEFKKTGDVCGQSNNSK